MKRSTIDGVVVEIGSDNVFADLGLPDADTLLMRATLVVHIKKEIESRGWTQAEAAEALGIHQPHVSRLLRNGKGFSIDKLVNMLSTLGWKAKVVLNRSSD
ncbi:MAG: helix-turn-helix domain-containing protein [Fimbriiglobus sp.]